MIILKVKSKGYRGIRSKEYEFKNLISGLIQYYKELYLYLFDDNTVKSITLYEVTPMTVIIHRRRKRTKR